MNPHEQSGQGGRRYSTRFPNVQQALQFSPFTSIVPFDASVIPCVSTAPFRFASNQVDEEQLRLSRKQMQKLDQEASEPQQTSDLLAKTFKDLRTLLKDSDLGQIQFKHSSGAQLDASQPAQNGLSGAHPNPSSPHLGPFATRFLETVEAPSPSIPRSKPAIPTQPKPRSPTAVSKPVPPPKPEPQPIPTPQPEFVIKIPKIDTSEWNQNSAILEQSVQPPAPSPSKPLKQEQQDESHPSSSAMIMLPQLSAPKSEYISHTEVDAMYDGASTPSKKRKREDVNAKIRDSHVEQRTVAFATLKEFQEALAQTFEAEDFMVSDTSGMSMSTSTKLFVPALSAEGPKTVLSSEALKRFDNTLSNVASFGLLLDVPIPDIHRLQKLCVACLEDVSGMNLSAPESDDMAIQSWMERMQAAENGLQASKILLRIMLAGKTEKQLLSEESLLEISENLRNTLETCILPCAEQGASSDTWSTLDTDERRNAVTGLLTRAGRVMKILSDLVVTSGISESVVSVVESLTIKLIFAEAVSSEKDSITGVRRFENLRRNAMDLLARVFQKHETQRRYIIDETLSSLEKLPVVRQKARHYKTTDGKSIQLVSALILQLVQISSCSTSIKQRNASKQDRDMAESDSDGDAGSEYENETRGTPKKPKLHQNPTAQRLRENPVMSTLFEHVESLAETARKNAMYVIHYLVQRALKSRKTGDEPYRNLLDIFTEDWLNVLGSYEWPGAELLLRMLLTNLVGIADDNKSTAPSKTMALDIMGLIGSGVADLQSSVNRTAAGSEDRVQDKNTLARQLQLFAEGSMEGKNQDAEILSPKGPFRIIYEHLSAQGSDLRFDHARQLFLLQWGQNICTGYDMSTRQAEGEGSADVPEIYQHGAQWVLRILTDHEYAENSFDSTTPTEAQLKLSQALCALSSPCCKALQRIIRTLWASSSSHHITVRSRSLKSVRQILEKDPTMLSRSNTVLSMVLRSASDPSPAVRDSTLDLIGSCLAIQPQLEDQFLDTIIEKTADPAIAVRKKSLRLLKDTYLRTAHQDVKSAIADGFLKSMDDGEDSVSEVARETLFEIWLKPFHAIAAQPDPPIKNKQKLRDHALLIVKTAQKGQRVLDLLDRLFKDNLKNDSKYSKENTIVVNKLITILFDVVVENETSQASVLQTLTIFAKAHPKLFSGEQMMLLMPYIEHLSNNDNLLVYRSVIAIYRCVLPVLPPLQKDFLRKVQDLLMQTVPRLGKAELTEVAQCLNIIDEVLRNTGRLVKLMRSVMLPLQKGTESPVKSRRYLQIAGSFGGACNFESFLEDFKTAFPSWKGSSVSLLICEIICPYVGQKQPLEVRQAALESVLQVSKFSPKNFLDSNVIKVIEIGLRGGDATLQLVALNGINAFFSVEEDRSKSGAEVPVGNGSTSGEQRLGKSMVLSDNDGAATSIAQHFLTDVQKIALASDDELALAATRFVTSTNRQGLVHPKECGTVLVALETCPNMQIAKIAFEEHQNLHHKHESMLEKEYIRAIERAFEYQRKTIEDMNGVDKAGQPKLKFFFQVLRGGSVALRKKLFGNLVARLDASLFKKAVGSDIQVTVAYSRFVLENLGLCEYGRIDEILHLMTCIEKVFKKSGVKLSQQIETIPSLRKESGENGEAAANGLSDIPDASVIGPLAVASVHLATMWETRNYLRQTWSLSSYVGKKLATKDVNKPPTKSTNAVPERYLARMAELVRTLDSEESMRAQCRDFVDLIAVDSEHTVAEDEETREGSASDADGDVAMENGVSNHTGRGGSESANATPKKSKRPSVGRRRSGSAAHYADEDYDSVGSTPSKQRSRVSGGVRFEDGDWA